MHSSCAFAALVSLALCRLASADDAPEADDEDGKGTEVIVVEDREPEPDQVRLEAAHLREVPGAFGDPVRAATGLPGMVPTDANRPEVYVRGAPPGNTEMLVDGIRVPLVFHGGVATSVIPSVLVGAVNVFASAAPARYGGAAGGLFEVETTAPSDQPRAAARLTVYEAGGIVETPVADGRGSLLAAARFGDPQLVIGLVSDADVKLRYWDYQARTTWRLGDHDQVALVAFGSHDHLSEVEPAEDPMTPEMLVDQLVSNFHRVAARYEHETERTQLRAALIGGWTVQGAGGDTVRDLSYGARLDGERRVTSSVRVRAGAHLDHDAYEVNASSGDDPAAASPANVLPPPRNTFAGVHADVVWDLTDTLRSIAGARFDAYNSTRAVDGASGTEPALEPRLGLRWRARPDFVVTAAAGLAHQYPLLRVGSAPTTAISVPGFWAGSRRLQSARQANAGIELLFPDGIVGTATAFASQTLALTDLRRNCGRIRINGEPTQTSCGDVRGTGLAYGLELLLRRPLTARLGGWLAYTFSHATEEVPTAEGTRTLRSQFDRMHVASAAAAYQLSTHWRASARVIAYSGAPAQVPGADGTPQEIRLPWYERVDLRAERSWHFESGRSMSLVIDVLNATLSRVHDRVECEGTSCTVMAGSLFFVPSVGLEGSL